ncbi:hypothetical protein D3C80_1638210 [compost metagenome]
MQLGFETLDLGLEWPRIDLEQQVAFLHQAAFVERHPVDKAGHPRADIHRFGGFKTPGEFIPFVDRLLDDFGDADLRRGHLLGGLRGLAAGAEQQDGGKGQRQRPDRVVGLFHG